MYTKKSQVKFYM